jgi:hypothetical protein
MKHVYNLYRVKTILATVLTVVSGMDPYMISFDTGWDWIGREFLRFFWIVWLVTVRL